MACGKHGYECFVTFKEILHMTLGSFDYLDIHL